MSGPVCYIEPDLRAALLRVDGRAQRWEEGAAGGEASRTAGDGGDDVMGSVDVVRRRAAEAAAWVARSLAGRRGKALAVCVGPDGASFRMVAAPSAESSVVAAALRREEDPLFEDLAADAIEPFASSEGNAKRSPLFGRLATGASAKAQASENAAPLLVLTAPLASVRVFLDELDARGVTVVSVGTLWHALCAAWDAPSGEKADEAEDGPAAELTAVAALLGDGRLAWSWSRGGALLVGGSERSGPIEDAAGREPERMSTLRAPLEWLSWSAQLGESPSRVVVVGAGADRAHGVFERLWPEAMVRGIEAEDPLGETLAALESAEAPGALEELRSVAGRSTRAHKRLMRWGALTALVAAAALFVFGFRTLGAVGEIEAEREELGKMTVDVIAGVDPAYASRPDRVRLLESKLAELRQQPSEVEEPTGPYPMHEELGKLLAFLGGHEGVKVESVSMDERGCRASLRVETLVAAEGVASLVREVSERLVWTGQVGRTVGEERSVTLNGVWKLAS